MMSQYPTITPSRPEDFYGSLAGFVRPKLLHALEQATGEQRLRVTTLPEPVMEQVCVTLQNDARWEARILASSMNVSQPWRMTATKIIELRNSLSRPLIVFIPPGLRTAA